MSSEPVSFCNVLVLSEEAMVNMTNSSNDNLTASGESFTPLSFSSFSNSDGLTKPI